MTSVEDSQGIDGPYPSRTVPLTRNIEDVNADWLSAALALRYPGTQVDAMEITDLQNGHTTKIRVKVQFNAVGRDARLPDQLCLKSNWTGTARNHDICALEARFYHFHRDSIATPEVFFTDWDPLGQGLVVMEDLIAAGGRFGHSSDHLGVDGVAEVLAQLARFHASTWNSPALEAPWLPQSMNTLIDSDQVSVSFKFKEINMALPSYQKVLPAWLQADPMELKRVYSRLVDHESRQAGPLCLLHGDAHQGNSYVRPNGERIWLDWQLVRKGPPWRDVSYFLIGSLTVEERRAAESHLLAEYRDQLIAAGAQDVPDMERAWEAFRRWPIYGYQAWLGNQDEWGQIGLPITERFLTAMEDYDTVALLAQPQ